jgi:hypothetical protein
MTTPAMQGDNMIPVLPGARPTVGTQAFITTHQSIPIAGRHDRGECSALQSTTPTSCITSPDRVVGRPAPGCPVLASYFPDSI